MKVKKPLIVVLFAIVILPLLSGCNANETDKEGLFSYAYNNITKEGFVYSYKWDGNTDNMDIYIPDTINGIKITALGGFFEGGGRYIFDIEMPPEIKGSYIPQGMYPLGTPYDDQIVDKDYKTYNFNVYCGKYVEDCRIRSHYYYLIEDENHENQDVIFEVYITIH